MFFVVDLDGGGIVVSESRWDAGCDNAVVEVSFTADVDEADNPGAADVDDADADAAREADDDDEDDAVRGPRGRFVFPRRSRSSFSRRALNAAPTIDSKLPWRLR